MLPLGDSITPIGVLLVDDHKIMLWGLERLINGEKPHMQVVGKATNKTEIFEFLKVCKPDVVVLDVDLNGENSLDFLAELLQESQARVLVFSGSNDPLVHQRAIINGASGVVLKSENAEVLLRAIQYVHAGELWYDRAATSRLLRSLNAPAIESSKAAQLRKIATLTVKERQVISSMAVIAGARNKVVADRLCMSEHTLRNHLTSIYAKLDLENRLELCMFAIEHKL